MKKRILALILSICCFFSVSAYAEEVADGDIFTETESTDAVTRATQIKVVPKLEYRSSSQIRLTLELTGGSGATKVGYRDVALYKYTGTYWAWQANVSNDCFNSDQYIYIINILGNFTRGQYKVTGTAYSICSGIEYTTPISYEKTL